MTKQLQEMKARAEKVSGFCVDYMRQGIRHLQRNCDVECPTHEGDWEVCKQPDRYDGETMAQVLTENTKLIAALEAVEAVAIMGDNDIYSTGGACMANTLRHVIAEALA